MRVHLSNSAWIQNIDGFLRTLDTGEPENLEVTFHPNWVTVHPSVLALAACAAESVRLRGGSVRGEVPQVASLPYLIRMKLFDFLGIDPGRTITEHEAAGRFIPLTRVRSNEELRQVITELVPLLHAPPEVAAPIKYVFSEMARNVLEHAAAQEGAVVCAQYYQRSNRISIGIADAGRGMQASMQLHGVGSSKEAIALGLQPGVTGVTARPGGNETNAGAGLFFTKSIATLSRNFFLLYSGDAAFKLLRYPEGKVPTLNANPSKDNHRFLSGVPNWPGTVVGIDINVAEGRQFADLLDEIRKAYSIDVGARRKEYYKMIRFR